MERNTTVSLKKMYVLSLMIFGPTMDSLSAQEILKERGSSWDYLFYQSAAMPADPETIDADFHTTWNGASASFDNDYDGPQFLTGDAPLGYGEVPTNAFPTTNVWDLNDVTASPPSGTRLAAMYLRTTLPAPTNDVTVLTFTGVIDDGVIIYVNGDRVRSELVTPPDDLAASTWALQATDQGNENMDKSVRVPGLFLNAGFPIDIAISVHNSSDTGSDLMLDVEVEAFESDGPPNDDFANAQLLTELLNTTGVEFPIMVDTSNGDFGLGAGREQGEPDHAGNAGGGSIWYRYEASGFNRRVWVNVAESNFDTLLAVYTGDAVDNLTPVRTFPNWPDSPDAASSRDSAPFGEGARVEFDAVSGETYYIAVDGADGSFGSLELTYGNAFTGIGPDNPNDNPQLNAVFEGMDPVDELVGPGASWEFLLHTDVDTQPNDPALVDSDFFGVNGNPGWQTAAGYDGPIFGMAAAPLGYGTINALAMNGSNMAISGESNIWGNRDHDGDGELDSSPPSDARFTAYFRTTFTPDREISDLAVYGLLDDGAVIYINGVEGARINIADTADVNDWQLLAESVRPKNRSTEANPQAAVIRGLNLAANEPVEVAVSLHNAESTSSDLALNLQIFEQASPEVVEPPMTGDRPVLAISPTTADGAFDLNWVWEPGVNFEVQFSPVLENPTWTAVAEATVTEDNGSYSASVSVPFGVNPVGFYRVEEQ